MKNLKIIAASLLFFIISCKQDRIEKHDNEKVEPTAEESTKRDNDSGGYILEYDDSLKITAKAFRNSFFEKNAVSQNTDYENNWRLYQKEAIRFITKTLIINTEKYEVVGFTQVCAIIRVKDSISKTESALKFKGIKNVQKNYKIKHDFETIRKNRPPLNEVQWGVLRVSSSSKKDGKYKNAWVIDTGIDAGHEDLNFSPMSRSFITAETVTDYIGHGTHVAGIIGAKANAKGVVGVAPNAPICALKVFDKNKKLHVGQYILALEYVLQYSNFGDVVNLSMWRDTTEYTSETTLINQITLKGVNVVMAAGNFSQNLQTNPRFPPSLNGSKIYTVAAFDQGDKFALYSNFGTSLDYILPGTKITSTVPGDYGEMSGTSMAAPHLAGLLLLPTPLKSGGAIKGPDGKSYMIAHE